MLYWWFLSSIYMIKSFIHLFQVVPSIQKGNEGFVHHLTMFECDGNFTEEHFNQGVECSRRPDNNSSYPECISSTLIATWAVGGEVKKNNQVLCQRLLWANSWIRNALNKRFCTPSVLTSPTRFAPPNPHPHPLRPTPHPPLFPTSSPWVRQVTIMLSHLERQNICASFLHWSAELSRNVYSRAMKGRK